MIPLARTAVTPVWAGLMLATAWSWWLGTDHALGIDDREATTALIVLVAFIKVRFVGAYFMELRHAPPALRLAFDGWVLATCAAILVIYLLS
jgi:hypothetical protein